MCATIPLHRSLDGALSGVLWNIFLHSYSLCAFEGNTLKRKQETTQVNLTLQVPITFLLGFQRTVETIVFPLFILCSSISYSLQSCWASCTERTLDTWLKKGILLIPFKFYQPFSFFIFPISIKWNKEHTYVLKLF